jgi:hypothetical protein
MVEKILGVKLDEKGRKVEYSDTRNEIYPYQVASRIRLGALNGMRTNNHDQGLVCYLTPDEFNLLKTLEEQKTGDPKNPQRTYSLKEVKQVADLYLEVHSKFAFVLKCNSWRIARNFPGANLVDDALIEFSTALREYQRLAPPDVQKVYRVDFEYYARIVEGVKKDCSEDESLLEVARREYRDRMWKGR